ncbi:MAG: dihydroneopterin aldolase [Pseudoclavibacter sp.]
MTDPDPEAGAEATTDTVAANAPAREPGSGRDTGTVHPATAAHGATATSPAPTAPAGLPAPELDVIRIEKMHARGYHGVLAHERRDGQEFLIDAEVWLDTRAAAASDDIDDTVHYGQLMRALFEVVSGEPVDLLETLAERLAAVTLAYRGAQAVRITVHKPQAPVDLRFEDVTVSILRFRGRDEAEAER